jgi:NADH-quinone oxidoreductase subunit N
MYFDEPADTIRGQSDWAHWALLAISTAAISPLGYLLTKPLGVLAARAAAALFLGA